LKRILVITNNLSQASFRVRMAALVEPLRERGFELIVQVRPRSFLPRRRLLKSASAYDAVILQRKFLDPSDARLLRRQARRIYYDVDDAVMLHQGSPGLISRWRTRRRFLATTRILDHAVTGNRHLADVFAKEGRPVTVIPTVVDPSRYRIKQHKPSTTTTLVWIGSHSTLPYLRECVPVLEKMSGIRLLIIADGSLVSPTLPIGHIPWSAETEADSLLQGDIGIAPTPDTPWTRGKCGFKIVQYMAAGLPVIASPIGANAEIVQENVTGYLPADYGAWPAVIERLARDVDLRTQLGQAGRRRAEAEYSIQRAADEWARILGG
jgi:glycosyltransferase involved in cell wall biosynthesis